ncbi:filamentous haemagglutinin family protein [Stenotrophomonas indicatrix]|uniref:filamentous haemagglutinin family protein n=1 Tax=Stenotrophomonas indicatrix TaxID=2045451 RepID=UPI0028B10F36|nr:filamentous haemagglutinin family protein [Stenotrophomonas indicatrix]
MSLPHTSAVHSAAPMRRNHPMAWAIAVALGTLAAPASHAQQAFSPGWFADRGAAQGAAAQSGRMPNGVPIQFQLPAQQQDAARQKLQQSIDNLGTAAQAIALQQRMQEQARQARRDAGFVVADGLGKDGLKVDENPLTRGWVNAREAIQSQGSDGRVQVSIEQTADQAILNWETFNIGGNTTLNFLQNPDWAVLNRVNDPNARPSQILGQLKANGTVFVANRNGVVFGNNSQVNVRNLVAAAARISDAQFRDNGLYSADTNTSALTDAVGKVMVERGARITTHEPTSATRGGGYVLLAGHSVENAGQIETRKGQVQLAAGDSFVIRRGVGTAANTASTTRGNEIAPRLVNDSSAGSVRNTGLLLAREGDITLAGRSVEQAGVAVASTTLGQRGTVHLLASASDTRAKVTLAEGSTTAVLIEDDGKSSALDTQRDALLKESAEQDALRAASRTTTFDNLSLHSDRRDQSRVEIVSGGDIHFQGNSLTVATGGQVIADAGRRSQLDNGARVDVSGAVGVHVAMESNNVQVKVQGNELRDSPDNRDSGKLTSSEVWIDRRQLIHVPAGTGGHEGDRWYAAGGLLEVGGYLDNQGHSISEWAAQGGTVLLGGSEVVAAAGSRINLAGGSLDVQSGAIQQSWLRGIDGQVYRLDDAPAEMLFDGLYKGYEVKQERWGVTEAFRNPIVFAAQRTDNGYTVGRDAGRLVVSAPTAVLDGQVETTTFQGAQQGRRPDAALEGYAQAQTAVARNAGLYLGRYDAQGRNGVFDSDVHVRGATTGTATAGVSLQSPIVSERRNTVWLDAGLVNAQQWGSMDLASAGNVAVDAPLALQAGGALNLIGSTVNVAGDIRIVGGQLQAGNLLDVLGRPTALLRDGRASVAIADGTRIDLAGGWSNASFGAGQDSGRAWIDGGSLRLQSSHDVTVGSRVAVDVDAGAALDMQGKGRIGKGGGVSLQANTAEVATDGSGRVRLGEGSYFSGRGEGGGTFALGTGGKAVVGAAEQDVTVLQLDTALFGSGFAQYDINAHQGLDVADGTQLVARMPGLRLAEDARTARDRASALQPWSAPLYAADPQSGRIRQRSGASITLRSDRNSVGGDLRVGRDARVAVDPGQAITLLGAGNIDVEGTLQARGGRISIDDVRPDTALYAGQRSERTWRIDDGAVLDASADSVSMVDAAGRLRGQVRTGGRIEIGGALDWETSAFVDNRPPEAFIVVERGARLDARGASAQLDIDGQGRTRVDSDGGQIVLRSANALYLQGAMDAAAGGSGARGGTLGLAFGGSVHARGATEEVLRERVITLSQQTAAETSLPARLDYGHAALSVQQIQAGGFDNLSVFGDIRTLGNVDLRMAESLRIHGQGQSSLGVAAGASTPSAISLSAPYVRLAQARWKQLSGESLQFTQGAVSATAGDHALAVNGDLIDLRDVTWLPSFDHLSLNSRSDVRLLSSIASNAAVSSLLAPGSIDLIAARLYPTFGAVGRVVAGASAQTVDTVDYWANPDAVLRIKGNGTASGVPASAFGSLRLVAATVQQGGAVWAPMGTLQLGGLAVGGTAGGRVELLPGSITSTSGAGLALPYGGTADGVNWRIGSRSVDSLTAGGISSMGVTLKANQVNVSPDALLDMSGGGDLTGAAFISGRGGSVDVLRTALADANPRYAFSASGNPVYAIVPGYTGAFAPTSTDGFAAPGIGQQITVPAGVPGLPAGTYTLLPANFALQPGAFRVELGATGASGISRPLQTGTGTWRVSGHQRGDLGGVESPLLTDLLLTPAAAVRRHSGYNETSYNAFVQATADRRGESRGWQTIDALGLTLALGEGAGRQGAAAIDFGGTARFAAANDKGRGGTLVASMANPAIGTLEIIGADGVAQARDRGVTFTDQALNAFQPARMVIGGQINQAASQVAVTGQARSVAIRSGATLQAPEVLVAGASGGSGILVEAGATVDTLPYARNGGDTVETLPYQVTGGLLAVSNQRLNLITGSTGVAAGPVAIDIGGCQDACEGQARLVSDGSIAVATDGTLQLRDSASYGTRQLGVSMAALNLGSAEAIAQAAAAGALPAGMTMNQMVLQQLLRGNVATGAPALDTLSLVARDSVNVFGSVDLDARDSATGVGSLRTLVLGAQAIHGYGNASDRARILVDTLVWDGALAATQATGSNVAVPPSEPMVDRLGEGQLDIVTRTLTLGRAPYSRPSSEVAANRQVLGFSALNLGASEQMVFSAKGTLDVYQQRGEYLADKGWQYSGGSVAISTPLLTADPGAQLALRTGGSFALHGGNGKAGGDALGSELSIDADRILLDSTIALASGRLSASARQGIGVGAHAALDLAGRKVSLFDVDKYSWGGDVLLSSDSGEVTTDAASRIDVSARNNRGGRLTVNALAGRADLAGRVDGAASGRYDAGGTVVPYDAGELVVRARQLLDFAGLNQRLNSGGVTGARTFQIGEGDLQIGDEVKARRVDISVDKGSLTVAGRIDASGEQVGSIRLYARDALQVNGTLDAHGSGLRVDSYGKIIDSANRATVELGSAAGQVSIGAGAAIDLRAGSGVAVGSQRGQNDGVARGTLKIDVPRIGTDDAAIAVASGVRITGAADIQVNGVRRYDDAPLASSVDVHGNRAQVVTQQWLDQIVDPDNRTWMDGALANADLQQRTTALGSHRLRPGVQVVARRSADNPGGDLTVSGDIDLSGYRYGPDADRLDPARRGFGESASLVLRAEGNLNIHGSINDGFAPPPANPDEAGWELIEGRSSGAANTPFGGGLVVPVDGVQLQPGTEFPAGATLNYAVPVESAVLPAGTVLPAAMTLADSLRLPAGTVLGAAVTTRDGQTFAAGTLLDQPLQLEAGARLGGGFRLRSSVQMAAQDWPAGAVLPIALRLARAVDLKVGAYIPSMTKVELAADAPVKLRPADANGNQGRNWALAPMLAEGTTSWDLTAVAGADSDAADPRTRRWGSDGSVVLADTHQGSVGTVKTEIIFVGDRVLTEQASLDWMGDTSYAGRPIAELADIFGYTEEEFCALADGYCGPAPRQVAAQGSLDFWGDESYVGTSAKDFAAIFGMTEDEFCGSAPTYCFGGGTQTEVTTYGKRPGTPAWSVLRTGKGDLELLAAGDVVMKSGFGVYTAGTPTSLGNGRDADFNSPRAPAPWNSALLGKGVVPGSYDAALAGYQAWYPDHGGNLRVEAGRDIVGDVWTARAESGSTDRDMALHGSAAVGNWLWRQGTGSTAGVKPVPTSWWVNFGTYANVSATAGSTPRMVGFTGFGTLGGGNLTLDAGRNAGVREAMGDALGFMTAPHSGAIVAAVGSTGRVSDGQLYLTGGGDLRLRTGGVLNPELTATFSSLNTARAAQDLDLNGTFTNLRGSLLLEAGRIGGMGVTLENYGTLGRQRAADLFAADSARAMGGPVLVLGDATASLQARGDVVLGGVGDAGRVAVANYSGVTQDNGSRAAGTTWFSLWTASTAVDLFSAGGDLSPGVAGPLNLSGSNLGAEQVQLQVGGRDLLQYWLYPSRFSAVAAQGNITFDRLSMQDNTQDVLLLAPSASGRLDVLAGGGIFAQPGATQIARSAADTRMPGPFDPAFMAQVGDGNGNLTRPHHNLSVDGHSATPEAALPLFAFGPNTPLSNLPGALSPSRFYAVGGDIIGLQSGAQRTLDRSGSQRTQFALFEAAGAVQMRAGRDILGVSLTALNSTATDVSVVDAGRDIVHLDAVVAGPGNLEVSAGRQLRQEDVGSIVTLGGIVQGDARSGASVGLTAGNQQIDFAALRARYLDPANLADPAQSLAAQPGKAVKIYDKELKQWLQQRFGTSSEGSDALAAFDALPKEQQRIFLREVYYAELREGGREYTHAEGPRFGSYLRGREAIATLMPDKDANGATINRAGDIVMYGGSGVRTEAGGNIELMAPGGQIVVGVQGVVPPASAGLVTQGQGDIRLFSQDSVLLGLSRVMTTFGGDILAWSEQGDINAGRGSQTTLLYTPPRRVYDTWGNVILSPQAPASGAGIATLNPIAEVAPGDVDLIAPLGTIDAGEAGIRVSGNINLAALQVLNAANIQVQGDSKGLPVLASVNVNALASASAAANSASQAAQDVMRKSQDDARRNQPSVISVQILGFGSASSSIDPPARGNTAAASGYDVNSAFQFPQARADAGKQQVQ